MTLFIPKMAGRGLFTARHHHVPIPPPASSSSSPFSNSLSFSSPRRSTHVARARKGLSSRTRRLENRGKKGAATTTKEEEERAEELEGVALGEEASSSAASLEVGGGGAEKFTALPMPELPGEEPDFWEGPQWNAFGFFVRYQWAFGIVFALIACGIAVATYNEGATDFRQTLVYKESIRSQELLEEPEASNSDVFEGNPTEVAPSLE